MLISSGPRAFLVIASLFGTATVSSAAPPDNSNMTNVVTGDAAFHGFDGQKPGLVRKITVADLPKPYATEGVSNSPHVVPRPGERVASSPDRIQSRVVCGSPQRSA